MPVKKKSRSAGSKRRQRLVMKHNVVTSENDNLSRGMADLVPDEFKDQDRFIDIIQWNLEWFGAAKSTEKDKQRFGPIVDILTSLNSDLFVFQEVAGPTSDGRYPGVLDTQKNTDAGML